jgi:hypothetical protein
MEASSTSSYNAVPFLALLSQETGERKYLDSALRAADYIWSVYGEQGVFVGGTIDNPEWGKEAGALTLEALSRSTRLPAMPNGWSAPAPLRITPRRGFGSGTCPCPWKQTAELKGSAAFPPTAFRDHRRSVGGWMHTGLVHRG